MSSMDQISRRRYGPSKFQLEMDRAREEAPNTERCHFCDWSFVGTVAEGRLEHRAHRTKEHGWKPKKKRKR